MSDNPKVMMDRLKLLLARMVREQRSSLPSGDLIREIFPIQEDIMEQLEARLKLGPTQEANWELYTYIRSGMANELLHSYPQFQHQLYLALDSYRREGNLVFRSMLDHFLN